jgi:alpha-tubulin suppressor-like RCC1 family protein
MLTDPSRIRHPFVHVGTRYAVCLLLGACGYPEEDKAIVRRWLKCEECTDKELDAVQSAGNRIVPLLREALKGPSAERTANVRRQLEETHKRLQTPALGLDSFSGHYLSNYKALYQSRAITGLSKIGTPKAQDALKNALADTAQSDTIYRPDVLRQLMHAVAGTWTVLSAGSLRTCGLRPNGRLYCWGHNDVGQLGDGTTLRRLNPTLIADSLEFTSIATGVLASHTCGIAGKQVYCWGNNGRGQLGNGSTANSPVPALVAGGNRYIGVAVGENHTCAWTPANRGYCWGGNDVGQLGEGSTDDTVHATPIFVDLGLRSIRAGASHTCADSIIGRIHCWGRGIDGQLGDGSNDTLLTPGQANTPVVAKTLSLSAGANHTCVLNQRRIATPTLNLVEGTAYCTGNNSNGQLGDGTTTSRNVLTRVSGGNIFLAISSGERHTCGIIRRTRILLCWGDNTFGQLGNGTTTPATSPVVVSPSLRFAAVTAGAGHTCGVTTEGAALCWGRNNTGQLGDGTTDDRSEPTPVNP